MTGRHDSRFMKFIKTGDDEWTSKGVNRGFSAVITFTQAPATDRFAIVINPGAIASSHDTLHKAKNQFRKFLLDKPVT